jgi:hypothetical protein
MYSTGIRSILPRLQKSQRSFGDGTAQLGVAGLHGALAKLRACCNNVDFQVFQSKFCMSLCCLKNCLFDYHNPEHSSTAVEVILASYAV